MKRKLIASLLSAIALAGTTFVMTSCNNETVPQKEEMKHIVSFYSNGGSAVENQKVEPYGLIQKPANPTLDGYAFAGWYLDRDCLVEWIFDTDVVTENITLYAKWDLYGIFVIHFNTKGGSTISGENVEIGSKIKKPTDPTREGYIFENWYQDEECTILWDFDKDTIKDNTTLYAKWTPEQVDPAKEYWTITIDLDNGTTPSTKKVEKGQKLTGVSEPTKDGYTFTGWKANGANWTMDEAITADITIVAQWEEVVDPAKEYWIVTINLDNGTTPTTKKVEKGQKLTGISEPTKDGYTFTGWKVNGANWTMDEAITADITIVAQWTIINPVVETVTIHFDSNGGSSIANRKVEKNKPMSQPLDPERPGYEFTGWYNSNQKWDFNQNITEEMTLVAQWKELKYTISFDNNGHCSTTFSDRLESFVPDDLPTLSDSTYLFVGWYMDAEGNEKVVAGEKLTDNITLYAKWVTENDINITVASGHLESAYLEWSKQDGINDYNVYYKAKAASDSSYVKIDKPLIREYATYYRADVLGLAAGDYTLKVESVINNGVGVSATRNVSVIAHERSGFAFSQNSKYKTASGAYNDDGTLKSDAEVIYVTAQNAKTVTCTIDGTEFTGIQAILTAKQKGSTKPLAIRMIGLIDVDDLDSCGSSAEGLQVKGKNAFAEMNVTIEGVGEDATIFGFGFLIRNCGNVEIRNFGIMNQMDDGISIDTDNCNIWVHNLDIYYGKKGSGDKAKGDGSVDTKQSTNVTISYNHFWDSGKCNLQGMKSETTSNYITYHHNWYDHSDSRHPRIRTCTVHIYNNYFDGNAKYGVGMTSGGSAFVENNFFRNCKNPMMISLQGTDALGAKGTFSGESGGVIKAYGNHIEGDSDTKVISYTENNTSFDAYIASSRDEIVPSTVKALSGGTTYNNFDTDSSIMYTYSVDTPEVAKTKVTTYAGRINGGDLKWTFDNATQDRNYDIIPELSNAVLNYSSSLIRVLGI